MASAATLHPTQPTERVSNVEQRPFAPTVPVIDISQFENPATRGEFLKSLEKAAEVGFFAVINPEIDVDTIQAGYDAFKKFFASKREQKMSINKPELNGQRGYVPGETALGSKKADNKEFVHIGESDNLWPPHMDLEEPAMRLFYKLKEMSQPLLQAIALVLGQRDDFLTGMTEKGANLLRALHYFLNPQEGLWATEHTDIDLLTILPFASEEGLEVEINGEWIPVIVPKNALIVNVGDMLEAYSNGRFPSCNHRVRCTKPNTERESIVFFIHPTDTTVIGPLGEEPHKFPFGTRLEYLFLRLFSLGLLSREMDEQVVKGSFIGRIKKMVEENQAAEAVNRWYKGFQKTFTAKEAAKKQDV